MKLPLSLILTVLLPLFVAAQSTQSVSGTITDEAGKAPLANVLVRMLADTNLRTTTDARGQFRITQVPTGRQSLHNGLSGRHIHSAGQRS